MKKIGILTLHRADNYGAVLQNYALQTAIRKLGFYSETIDYIIPEIEEEYKIKLFTFRKNIFLLISDLFWNVKNYKNEKINKKKFNEFRKNKILISEKKYNSNNLDNCVYDLYIVGSDQVWNNGIIRAGNEKFYDLSFVNSGKKVSYAASCGSLTSIIPNIDALRDFDYVTVREEQLQKYLEKNNICSSVVCDPTILLTKDEWSELFSTNTNEKYVFLYYIDSGKNEAAKIAKYIASKNNIKVHYPKKYDKESIKNKYGINTFYDGPIDFIQSISSAEFVVVSSFHGVVFSILMEKNFIALLHIETGARVSDLLKKLGLEDRIVSSFSDFKTKKFKNIDYSKVTPLVQKWREESLAILVSMCEL